MMMTDAKHRTRRGKKRFVVGVATAVLLLLFFLWQQNGIQCQTVEIKDTDLPEAFDGLRIVHISDLHGKQFGENSARLLRRVEQLRPDLIAITGDLIDREEQMAMLPALTRGLAELAPTYYVTGNHEWAVGGIKQIKALLNECGVRVLSNDYDLWEKDGATLAVAGVDDPNGPYDQKTGDVLRKEITAEYTLLLSHRDAVEEYAGWGYDLVLCGHGHGGILRIPLLDKGVLGTNRAFFPTYDGGLTQGPEGNFCFISRGLGSNTVPIHAFRLFNRPDLPLIILRSGE